MHLHILTTSMDEEIKEFYFCVRISCLSTPFLGKVLTCVATYKKEENQKDRYVIVLCKEGEAVGHLNCVCDESLIITKTKIHTKSFAVANKSTKTAKVFHSKTFASYGILLAFNLKSRLSVT